MNRITTVMATVLLVAGAAHAQTSAGAQAGAGASAQSHDGASAQRGSGAQASGNGSASTSANASAQVGQSSVDLSDGTTMNAALAGSLDAGKSKPGDRVEARTTQDVKQAGKVVVPKGTHLIGHVTQAQTRVKGQTQSSLGVVFDQAIMRDGSQVPMNLAIQALAVSQSEFQAGHDSFSDSGAPALANVANSGSASAGGGIAGGGLVGGTLGATTNTVGSVGGVAAGAGQTAGAGVGSTVNTATHSAGSIGGPNAAGVLTSDSHGVFGLQGLSMDGAASSATQGSMIVSSTRNVHLDSGTQMLLRVAGQAH